MSPEPRPRAVELAVSFVLRMGVVLSAAIICLGLVLLAAKGSLARGTRIDAAIAFPRDLAAVLSGVIALDPASVMLLGLLVLAATPILRVAVSILAFAIERDWRYVAVTGLVLAILIVSMALGNSM